MNLTSTLHRGTVTRTLVFCAALAVACAHVVADTPPKIEFQFLLFPDTAKTADQRDLVACMVNTGLENKLIEDDNDRLELEIPVGNGAGDLADAVGIVGLGCVAPVDWQCSVDHAPAITTVTFGPVVEAVIPPASTRCFHLTGATTNAVEGLVFTTMTQFIAAQRALNPVNSILPVFKSAEGLIEHDDLAEVLPDQHHPQVFEVLGNDIRNLNSGNVLIVKNLGIGTNLPTAPLHVDGDALFTPPGGQMRVTTVLGSAGLIANDFTGDRRDLGFDTHGIRLLTSSDASAPNSVNGLRISESGTVRIGNAASGTTIHLIPNDNGRGAAVSMQDSGANSTVVIQAEHQHAGGRILLRDPNNTASQIQIDSNWEDTGDSRIVTNVIEITGGADLSENFDVSGEVRPGMVVSIDPSDSGRLTVSERPYDRRVAGVISGANGLRSGMLMGQSGSAADGEYPVALSGRVYCLADESTGRIRPGDLITTSDLPGHCMRVRKPRRAHGAILGKAMSEVEDGFVLVLVNLQ